MTLSIVMEGKTRSDAQDRRSLFVVMVPATPTKTARPAPMTADPAEKRVELEKKESRKGEAIPIVVWAIVAAALEIVIAMMAALASAIVVRMHARCVMSAPRMRKGEGKEHRR